ncbi:hypothetical protein ERICIV_04419 [Paenibacillus larvae subsp. larvae]|uniref:Yip1 domain-containing protein n=1 Tax=Paenibacillus larvae subsp. larvae TaxID=147375 RepID=A0A2L1UK28_9BACL|nr:hypothetical protein [Paenibacillus larvae]AQT84909.1 hypothetical protein B1222_11780 [Paenibacillus larvae subsp. pulvifaciens]AQZ46912.1 hypothetical protein B5S25_10215 [Paenibacillus larvae subsp. pulvifaciens]AVF28682.1 hypothetical protein ERICIII_04673 [Paenibacillus larvae subsp. larvae]AVF33188.1 hypothetical protein ERICIV_04419 [Paenibacillus larvae subsp. larvae]MBH0343054.1 hypothetical protein [Paenibacillus larvae]
MLSGLHFKEKKWHYYFLFGVTYLILSSTILLAIVSDMSDDEFGNIQHLFSEKKIPMLALLGICLIFFLLFVFVQIFFVAFVLYLIARFLFSIQTTFPLFFQIVLKCSVLFSLSILTHIVLASDVPYEKWLLALNPFLLVCFVMLYVKIRKHLAASLQKALLFSSSLYILYISIQIIQGG